jgi:formylglycine-generating enzyme required for sulfatase activity
VLRGGGANYGQSACTSSARINVDPDYRNYDIGFRVARTP